MKTTKNYGLKIPEPIDNIEDLPEILEYNFNLIDSKLKELENK